MQAAAFLNRRIMMGYAVMLVAYRGNVVDQL